MFKVEIRSGTGHEDLDAENEADEPEIVEFATEAERAAYIRGINRAANTLDGWIDGWITAEAV